jgi:hypothetical protein
VSVTDILANQGEGKHETQALTCQLLLPKQFSASLLLPTLRSEFHFFDPGNPIARLPSLVRGHASTPYRKVYIGVGRASKQCEVIEIAIAYLHISDTPEICPTRVNSLFAGHSVRMVWTLLGQIEGDDDDGSQKT